MIHVLFVEQPASSGQSERCLLPFSLLSSFLVWSLFLLIYVILKPFTSTITFSSSAVWHNLPVLYVDGIWIHYQKVEIQTARSCL